MKNKTQTFAEYRTWPMWYYHMTFDSLEKGQLFNNDDEYANGMNSIAIGQYIHKLSIISFVLMVNHCHVLLYGTGDGIVRFFKFVTRRINKSLRAHGFPPLPGKYGFKLVRIEDKKQLADTIVYIARNPLKARPDITAGGYLWGSSCLIFSEIGKLFEKTELGNMSEREIKKVLRTHTIPPKHYLLNRAMGFILPESYVKTGKSEQTLHDSWKFSSSLIRNIDAYIKIAEGIGETVSISDGELDEIISQNIKKHFNSNSINNLSIDNRCKLAVILRKGYRIDKKRLARKLRIDLKVLEELLG